MSLCWRSSVGIADPLQMYFAGGNYDSFTQHSLCWSLPAFSVPAGCGRSHCGRHRLLGELDKVLSAAMGHGGI